MGPAGNAGRSGPQGERGSAGERGPAGQPGSAGSPGILLSLLLSGYDLVYEDDQTRLDNCLSDFLITVRWISSQSPLQNYKTQPNRFFGSFNLDTHR